MIKYESYENNPTIESAEYVLPDDVKSISFSYDGGRLNVFINGEEVYSSMSAGNDFNIQLTK
jgi:hypothetical protein